MKQQKNKVSMREKLMGNKRFVMLLVFGIVFMTGSVLGTWALITYNSSLTGFVVTDNFGVPINFSEAFVIDSLSSPPDLLQKVEILTIDNPLSISQDYLLTYAGTIEDTIDSCDQDVGGDYFFYVRSTPGTSNNIIGNGTIVTIPTGVTLLYANSVLLPEACAGNYTGQVTLVPQ